LKTELTVIADSDQVQIRILRALFAGTPAEHQTCTC
jgi:hypothetical protein